MQVHPTGLLHRVVPRAQHTERPKAANCSHRTAGQPPDAVAEAAKKTMAFFQSGCVFQVVIERFKFSQVLSMLVNEKYHFDSKV